MNMSSIVAAHTGNSLREVFAQESVSRIAIIDDAFDPPVLAELDPDAPTAFYQELEDDAAAREKLVGLGIEVAAADELTDEHLQTLYQARNSLGVLDAPWQRLAGAHIRSKEEDLEPLRKALSTDLTVEVECLGVYQALNDPSQPAPIMFVDYVLDPIGDEGALARRVVKRLIALYTGAGAPAPMVVLMSNREPSPDSITSFRKDTAVIGGMFYFIPKTELRDAARLFLRLGALVKSLSNGRRLQVFADTVTQGLARAQSEFADTIQALTLEDYAYIQTLALQADGHPLGDYLAWLFSAALGDLVFSQPGVSEQQKLIDELRFDTFPPTQQGPSHALVTMYQSAAVLKVDDVASHPRDPRGAATPRDEVYVHMGDIFRKSGSDRVWALITAECDLAFAPDTRTRKFPKTKSAVLIPGRLISLGEPIGQNDAAKTRTELFSDGTATYRIIWEAKRTRSLPLEELRRWLDDNELKREYRLRTPFALEVQRAFAADLTRIGMPVPPPFYQPVRVQLFSENGDGQIEQLTDALDGEVVSSLLRDREVCVLSDAFVSRILGSIENAIARLRDRRARLTGGGGATSPNAAKIATLDGHIRRLSELPQDIDSILALRGPHPIQTDRASTSKATALLSVYRASELAGAYQYPQPLALRIAYVPDVVESAAGDSEHSTAQGLTADDGAALPDATSGNLDDPEQRRGE